MSDPETLNLTPGEACTRIDAGTATLVDVRESAETHAMRAPGALLMPLSGFAPRAFAHGRTDFHLRLGQAQPDRA